MARAPAGAGHLNGTWEMEESLDVEWAHAMAPGASIDLIEANNDTNNADIFQAVQTAAGLPGVSVVSMSWGIPEYKTETTDRDLREPDHQPGFRR